MFTCAPWGQGSVLGSKDTVVKRDKPLCFWSLHSSRVNSYKIISCRSQPFATVALRVVSGIPGQFQIPPETPFTAGTCPFLNNLGPTRPPEHAGRHLVQAEACTPGRDEPPLKCQLDWEAAREEWPVVACAAPGPALMATQSLSPRNDIMQSWHREILHTPPRIVPPVQGERPGPSYWFPRNPGLATLYSPTKHVGRHEL